MPGNDMINTYNFISSFFKAIFLTAAMIGGLVAQSYSTTAWFADSETKNNTALISAQGSDANTPLADMALTNKTTSTFEFSFEKSPYKATPQAKSWPDNYAVLKLKAAELKRLKLAQTSKKINTASPILIFENNKREVLKMSPNYYQKGSNFKIKNEFIKPANDNHSSLSNDWPYETEKSSELDFC